MILRPVIVAVPSEAPPRTPAQVQHQRIAARTALRHCASLCGAPAEGWCKSETEVPMPNCGFHWSLSHKRDFAAAVIACKPVGIDIEKIEPRPHRLHDKLAGVEEWNLVGSQSWPAFYRLWTAKEATLKANGVGIAGFSSCRLVEIISAARMALIYEGARWMVEHHHHEDHVTALAIQAETGACATCVDEPDETIQPLDIDWCHLDGPLDSHSSCGGNAR